MGQLGANLGQLDPNLSRLITALVPIGCQPGQYWAQLGYGKRANSLFFICFSSIFGLSAFMQYWSPLKPTWWQLGCSLSSLGAKPGPVWAVLGPTSLILKPTWCLLGPSWGHLGANLGHRRAILATAFAILELTWPLSGQLGASKGPT